jgi:cytochrome c oxidase accessory protein FixG
LLLFATLGLYYIIPWIRWDRGPGAPDQAVLADFAVGRFYFFGLEIWPQEVYYITGLLILAAVGLFLATALFGRVWCGYFCPQTVWTDLFLVVERFFEGDRNARMKLDRSTLSAHKVARKTAKHATWLLVSFATGGAFILYWHDAPSLAQTFFAGQAPMTAYVFAGMLTLTTYALAGTMREQVCTYMCPWPRIQGALVDKDTLTRALKGASESMRDFFFSAMSQRAVKNMQDDIQSLGPIRLKEVDDAQQKMVLVTKDLAARGEIMISKNRAEDELVY